MPTEMSNRPRVLVIEDHPDIAEIISLHLTNASFETEIADDGKKGLQAYQLFQPDLILLDLMLPVIDGITVCKRLRKEHVALQPIIMLTAKGSESEIVQGLEAGADDYIVKPFKPKELVARVKASLRRTHVPTVKTSAKLTEKGIEVLLDQYEVRVDGELLKFTLTEFQLLAAMLQSKGRIFTRDQLIDRMKGHEVFIVDRNVDVHMSSIRKKLGPYGKMINTIRGVGYRFGDSPE